MSQVQAPMGKKQIMKWHPLTEVNLAYTPPTSEF